jgi:NNP family nitrate/nitrite transporter-like MFS transporter
MWFAIAPVMPTVKKPKCASSDSQICKDCALKFPGDDMKFSGNKDTPLAPKGAKDKVCKVCYPYEGRAKGAAGCGGLGFGPWEVKTSTMIGIAGTIILRITIGAISDGIGIRITYSILLILSCIPGFLLASAQSFAAVCIFRFIVGFAGASFVLTQLWTTTMFDLSVVGIANATSAGWGNLGGGVAQVLNTAVFASIKASGKTNDYAWRATVAWSPAVIFVLGVSVFFFSDDCPYGNFKELKKRNNAKDAAESELEALKAGGEPGTVAAKSLIDAALDWQTWVLHLCYMFSFGVELIVNGNIVSYFVENWAMSQEEAGLIGSVFGLLNICMRSLGGFWSDQFLVLFGVRGRLWALFWQTLAMGLCLISFSTLTPGTTNRGGLLINLILWGAFTNMTEGGTFAVVPYVLPHAVGGVAGIVGAGGNMGALLGGFMIMALKGKAGSGPSRMLAFCCLGWGALASACLVPCLWLRGIGSMFRASDVPEAPPAVQAAVYAGKAEQPMNSMAGGQQPQFVATNVQEA